MHTAHQWTIALAITGLCVGVGIPGCRREAPAEPNKPPAPRIPAGTPLKKPEPAVSSTLPSIRPPEAARPSASSPAPLPVSVALAKPAADVAPAAADDRDAPDTPPFFPRSGAIPNWAKVEPVKTAPAGELEKVMSGQAVKVADPYQIKRAAVCTYRLTLPNQTGTARVLLVETHQPDDAFGLFSVSATGAITRDGGALTATDVSSQRITIHTWKGRHYVLLEAQGSSGESIAENCKALLRKMTFQMPDAVPPELTEALPRPGLMPDQQWLIRGWASLAGPRAAALGLADAKGVAECLGLNKDAQMVIATYRVPGGARPHLVWVVRYGTPEEARKAYERYQAFLEKANDRQSGSTMLLKPSGHYLLGTWTAEEESIAPVLPKLRSNLG